jgi:2-C-methyl-D-erythritol 2,4-cyclodiphosphate synthase
VSDEFSEAIQLVENIRIGQGWDIHSYEAGKPLWLGGVQIPSEKGLKAHSDGDVIIHALIDALLGASGIGNIGRLFPDTSSDYKNANSLDLLQQTMKQIHPSWLVINVDGTVVCESILLNPYVEAMNNNIASLLHIQPHQVQIKPKRAEQLGSLGRDEGIMCMIVVLLFHRENRPT